MVVRLTTVIVQVQVFELSLVALQVVGHWMSARINGLIGMANIDTDSQIRFLGIVSNFIQNSIENLDAILEVLHCQ